MSVRDILMRYATPLTTWLFMISLVSGVALFFHVGTSYFREMHEILSMVLIVPFVLHVWRNWGTLIAYFRRSAMWIATAVSLAAAAVFVVGGSSESGGDPRMAVFSAVSNASVSALAELAKIDEATAIERLKAVGIEGAVAADTASALATKAGQDTFAVIGAVLKPAN